MMYGHKTFMLYAVNAAVIVSRNSGAICCYVHHTQQFGFN